MIETKAGRRNLCQLCGKVFIGRALRCWKCADHAQDWQDWATVRVAHAVRSGRLPSARTLTCACGDPAIGYGHRDYSKPLEVTPVCKRCNARNGDAFIPLERPRFQSSAGFWRT